MADWKKTIAESTEFLEARETLRQRREIEAQCLERVTLTSYETDIPHSTAHTIGTLLIRAHDPMAAGSVTAGMLAAAANELAVLHLALRASILCDDERRALGVFAYRCAERHRFGAEIAKRADAVERKHWRAELEERSHDRGWDDAHKELEARQALRREKAAVEKASKGGSADEERLARRRVRDAERRAAKRAAGGAVSGGEGATAAE